CDLFRQPGAHLLGGIVGQDDMGLGRRRLVLRDGAADLLRLVDGEVIENLRLDVPALRQLQPHRLVGGGGEFLGLVVGNAAHDAAPASSSGGGAIWLRPLPPFFATYMASSARLISASAVSGRSSREKTAPTERPSGKPSTPNSRSSRRPASCRRWAIDSAAGRPVSSSQIRNSSPPMREARSSARTRRRVSSATALSTASPVWWPRTSFTFLKLSRSK